MKRFKVSGKRAVNINHSLLKDIEKTYKYILVYDNYDLVGNTYCSEKGFSTLAKAIEYAAHIHESNCSIFNSKTGKKVFCK